MMFFQKLTEAYEMGTASFDEEKILLRAVNFAVPPKRGFGRAHDIHASRELPLEDKLRNPAAF